MRLSFSGLGVLALALLPTGLPGQEYKIEALKQPPPAALAEGVRSTLAGDGYRVVDAKGKTYAEFWLRKAVPASEPPGEPKGTVQFPFLAEGELLGALHFPGEGHDYRDQTINKGVYTIRYGLQPENGDHLGVSTYRDYVLLLPASKDTTTASLAKKPLEETSAESAGTSHPAVLLLLTSPASISNTPALNHNDEKNTWGAVVPLSLEVKGSSAPATRNVQIIVVGAAAA